MRYDSTSDPLIRFVAHNHESERVWFDHSHVPLLRGLASVIRLASDDDAPRIAVLIHDCLGIVRLVLLASETLYSSCHVHHSGKVVCLGQTIAYLELYPIFEVVAVWVGLCKRGQVEMGEVIVSEDLASQIVLTLCGDMILSGVLGGCPRRHDCQKSKACSYDFAEHF